MKNGLPPVRSWIRRAELGRATGRRRADRRSSSSMRRSRRAAPAAAAGSTTVASTAAWYSGRKLTSSSAAGAGDRLDQVGQERSLAGVEPVQVLETSDARLARGSRARATRCMTRRAAAAGAPRGPSRGAGRCGIGHAEEVEEQRQRRRRSSRRAAASARRSSRAPAPVAVVLADAEVGAQQLEHGQQRNGLAVRRAVRSKTGDARGRGSARRTRSRGGSCRRRPRRRCRRPGRRPAARLRERRLERRHLARRGRRSGEAARAGDVEPRAQRADALELVDADRLADALHARTRPRSRSAK